jgi:hypothetical protein
MKDTITWKFTNDGNFTASLSYKIQSEEIIPATLQAMIRRF